MNIKKATEKEYVLEFVNDNAHAKNDCLHKCIIKIEFKIGISYFS